MKRAVLILLVAIALAFGAASLAPRHTRAVPSVPALASESDAGKPRITEGPHVIYVSAHHAVIQWNTDTAATSVLHYGTSKSSLDHTERSRFSRTNHRFQLSRLKADTTYYFQAVSTDREGSASSDIGTFTTNDRGQHPTRFTDKH